MNTYLTAHMSISFSIRLELYKYCSFCMILKYHMV